MMVIGITGTMLQGLGIPILIKIYTEKVSLHILWRKTFSFENFLRIDGDNHA